MTKILPIFLFGTLLLTGFNTLAQPEFDYITLEKREILTFSKPLIKETKDKIYTIVELNGSTSMLTKAGEPILPIICKKYEFPIGTKIKKVDVIFTGEKTLSLTKKIIPAPSPILISSGENFEIEDIVEKKEIYSTNKLFPSKQFEYDIYSGLNGTNHVLILNLRCFPIQYIPEKNVIYSPRIL